MSLWKHPFLGKLNDEIYSLLIDNENKEVQKLCDFSQTPPSAIGFGAGAGDRVPKSQRSLITQSRKAGKDQDPVGTIGAFHLRAEAKVHQYLET